MIDALLLFMLKLLLTFCVVLKYRSNIFVVQVSISEETFCPLPCLAPYFPYIFSRESCKSTSQALENH